MAYLAGLAPGVSAKSPGALFYGSRNPWSGGHAPGGIVLTKFMPSPKKKVAPVVISRATPSSPVLPVLKQAPIAPVATPVVTVPVSSGASGGGGASGTSMVSSGGDGLSPPDITEPSMAGGMSLPVLLLVGVGAFLLLRRS